MLQIAICTSDSREGTHEFLEKMKLDSYVDMIVCGDDPDGKPKPNPHNCLHICKKLNVSPTDTIMVGDTPADTLMGQQAQLGLTVGVLTGVGGLHDLRDADVILSDVKECVDMILPEHAVPQEKPIAYQVCVLGPTYDLFLEFLKIKVLYPFISAMTPLLTLHVVNAYLCLFVIFR